jgi:subfamily B ATP-binding cassette protein MsbA
MKNDRYLKDYWRMVLLSKREWGTLGLGVVCMICSAAFDGVQLGIIVPVADKVFNSRAIVIPQGLPVFINDAVAWVNAIEPWTLFKMVLLFLPVMFILKGFFNYMQNVLMNKVAYKTMMHVRNDLYRKYMDLSLDFYSTKRQGELMSRFTNDVGFIGNAMSFGLTDSVYQSLQTVIYAIIAFTIDARLVLLVLMIFPIVGFVILKLGRRLRALALQSQEKMADLNSLLAETIQGIRIIKGFLREKQEIQRSETINNDYYKYIMKGLRRTAAISPLTEVFGVMVVLAILFMGGREVIKGRMSFGVFALFIASLLSILRPVKKLSQVHAYNELAVASSNRIYEFLDLKPTILEQASPVSLKAPVKSIVFEKVSFRYEQEGNMVLKGVSHVFPVGTTTAIVGPTGCGKSTILNLIMRFYDPQEGRILFDDVDIRTASFVSLRSIIGIVTQDMILFNETIRANLQFGNINAGDEQILAACRQALAYDFIQKLPKGLDTVIGDRGFRLSGGEKQRVCIARILLLDEATSALDSESEHLVQAALDNLMRGRTVLVVAHRLSTIKNASCILVMQDGAIVQKGTHDELLTSSELYHKLASYNFSA